jgi:hypothetical protein
LEGGSRPALFWQSGAVIDTQESAGDFHELWAEKRELTESK